MRENGINDGGDVQAIAAAATGGGFFGKFWRWYNLNKTFNTGLAAGLFVLQLWHLYWLTTNVVFYKLIGVSLFNLTGHTWQIMMAAVDYTEIPALILTSIVYVNEFRQKRAARSLLYLFLLNIQWVHIFWITDEIVIAQFTGMAPVLLPVWLAWLAISTDYLELPVIYVTIKKFLFSFKESFGKNSSWR